MPAEITLRHYQLWRESVAKNKPVVELQCGVEQGSMPLLTVIGSERRGLLADLTEVLSQAGLSVVSAKIFTLPNHSILDLFTLEDPLGVLKENENARIVYQDLFELIQGRGRERWREVEGEERVQYEKRGVNLSEGSGSGSGDASREGSLGDDLGASVTTLGSSKSLDVLESKSVVESKMKNGLVRNFSNIAVVGLHHVEENESATVFQEDLYRGENLWWYEDEKKDPVLTLFRVSRDQRWLLWKDRAVSLENCLGLMYGPQSDTFRDIGWRRRHREYLCFSLVCFADEYRTGNGSSAGASSVSNADLMHTRYSGSRYSSAHSSVHDDDPFRTIDLAADTDEVLTTWLLGLQSLCKANAPLAPTALYSLNSLLFERARLKIQYEAHARQLTVRQYILRKVRAEGRKRQLPSERALKLPRLPSLQQGAGHVMSTKEKTGANERELTAEIARLKLEVEQARLKEVTLTSRLKAAQASWEVDCRELMPEQRIGKGAFSEMWKGTWRSTPVAIKMLKFEPNQSGEEEGLKKFYEEVMVLSKLRHPNIVLFMAACARPPKVCIITEFCAGGNVYDAIRRSTWTTLGHLDFVSMSRDVARGVGYLHAMGLIHRDLKSQNLLLNRRITEGAKESQKPHIKVADFGLSRNLASNEGNSGASLGIMTSETGTYRWMAPEMMRHEPYNHKVDVYSFGIALWELWSREIPFSDMSPIQAAFAVADKGARPIRISPEARRRYIPRSWTKLIENCWASDPRLRPEFWQVVEILNEMERCDPNQIPKYWTSMVLQGQEQRQQQQQL